MSDDDLPLREALLTALRRLDALGMNRGSTGNVSHRATATDADTGAAMWITPTGMGADDIGAGDFVRVGADGASHGRWRPSSEAPFHRALYAARPELNAIVHCHSPHATALACLRRALPAFHYMVAVAGGDSVPCVPYHLYGSEALSQAVALAMRDRDACLLANHGLVAAGATLERAMKVAVEIESLAGIYLEALAVGEPVLLDAAQMAEVIERFRHYGQPARREGSDPSAR